jgi:polyhydroxyalkanoate synthesis regulator phasin
MHIYYHDNMMKTQENKMDQVLREALDDADKWYELYLGQKLANERLNDKIATLEEEVDSLRQVVYGSPDGN